MCSTIVKGVAGSASTPATQGADVALAIDKVKTNRLDKPLEDIKIINIEIKQSVE